MLFDQCGNFDVEPFFFCVAVDNGQTEPFLNAVLLTVCLKLLLFQART